MSTIQTKKWRQGNKYFEGKFFNEPFQGRYLVASRNISSQELIMRDTPCVIAPPAVTAPVCLECLTPLTMVSKVSPCPACSAPMCSTCVTCPTHHVAECELLQAAGTRLDIKDLTENNILYACIMPLRMWRTQEKDTTAWSKINFLQEDHSEAFCSQTIWREVADYIHDTLGIKAISRDEITRLSGIKEVNACSLTQSNDRAGTALYGVYPLMNSYCYCNTMYIINPDTRLMELRASRSIQEGEEITTRYVMPSMEQPARQEHIMKAWGFTCSCARCESPSELGSHYSSVRCGQCDHGYCQPLHVGVLGSDWGCDTCSHVVGQEHVMATLARCRAAMARAGGDLDKCEQCLATLEQHLHANHGFCVQMKTTMVSAYDRIIDKSRDQLDRQLQLAEDVLEVMDIIDPGQTPRRGGMLKHVLDVKMKIANRGVEDGTIDKSQHLEAMKKNMMLMREVMKCLRYSVVS